MMTIQSHRWLPIAALCLSAGLMPTIARGQLNRERPEGVKDVGVDENLNVSIPMDLAFVDSAGKPVTLGRYFQSGRPVILTLNYSDCPMLCVLQLNGLFAGLDEMEWSLGKEFEMITVSIDPAEPPERAAATKAKYVKEYGREGAAAGYHCLTGTEESIRHLAGTIGFRYQYSPVTKQYAHAAVTMVCTPDGRMSRYLYGVEYPKQTLRMALVEAGEGKIGTTMDRMLMFCFPYDAAAGRYGPSAFRMMQLAAAVTVLILGAVLVVYWRRDAKRKSLRVAKAPI